jgi:ubiquinone/menaquinone biosynthesis C-methylase UbiE
MRALGLALMLLASPVTGGGLPQPAESATADAAEIPPDHGEAGLEDRLGFLLPLTVPPGERVRDAICVLCSIVVRGTVERDAVAVWGGIDVEGEGRVGVDAVAVGGALRVSGRGRVEADPVAIGGPIEVAPGGVLLGEATSLPWLHFAGQRQIFVAGVAVFVGAHLLVALLGSLLLGERRVAHLASVWLWSPGPTLLWGLLVFTVVITLIWVAGSGSDGIATAAGIVGGLVLLAALAVGLPALALALGRRLRPGLGWRSTVSVGALVLAVASVVPLLGLVVSLLLWCAVCGLTVRGLAYGRAAAEANASGSPGDVLSYYSFGLEAGRLDEAYFPLERARTRELIERHLPPPPGVVLDVGGAAGAYAFGLAERGYEVHLVDPVPLHIEQAEQAAQTKTAGGLASTRVGDARKLEFADDSADAVLLLGPLYHLTERGERQAALQEARRVLRPGGWLFAAAISRFASLLDGLRGFVFEDEAFLRIVEQDLVDGQHRNDTDNPLYFTTAFFHHPDELSAEVREAGFTLAGLFAVEGPAAFVPEFQRRWKDPRNREKLLELLRLVDREPALLGASPHLLAVGQKPGD